MFTCNNLPTPGETYTITVITLSGDKESAPCQIDITALPSKVTNLTESGATSDSVSASWSPPAGVYDGYKVVCSNGSNSGPNNVSPNTTMFTCNGLPTPQETYTITVITLSGDKESEPCPIDITTLPSKVTNLAESGATTDSVSASWSPPDGVHDGYRVVCSNGSNTGPNDVTSNTTMFTCNNLPTPGEKYTITVITLSGDKESEPCPINITTLPSKVTNLTESGVTTDSVSASWSPPDGVYDGYRVVCSNGSNDGPNDVTSNTTMFTCNNLPTPGEKYTITVITLSGDKESKPCPINITTYVDACSSTPCKNGGTCTPTDGKNYMCTCPAGYTDVDCSEIVMCDVPTANTSLTNHNSCGQNSRVSYGVQCDFSCPDEYILEGNPFVICTRFGNFTGEFPICYSKNCINLENCPIDERLYFDVSQIMTGRRKRADIPAGAPVVRDLLSSVVDAVNGTSVVANANGTVLSANDDREGFISALILIDVTLLEDISVQDLISNLTAAIENIPGVMVEGSGQLNDICLEANPCLNSGECAVDSNSGGVSCRCPNGYTGSLCENIVDSGVDGGDTRTVLVIVLPIVAVFFVLLFVAMGFKAFAYRRMRWMRYYHWKRTVMYGRSHGMMGSYRRASYSGGRRPSQHRQSEPFVHEYTSGANRQRSRSVDPTHSGYIASTFVHELEDQVELSRRKNASTVGGMFIHDTEPGELYYRRTVDANGFSYGHPTSSGYNTKESYTNGASRRTGLYNSYDGNLDTYF